MRKRLLTSKDLLTHKDLSFRRKVNQNRDIYKVIVGEPFWREKKDGNHANSNRSFILLQKQFLKELTLISTSLVSGERTLEQAVSASKICFSSFYKKAYFLGMKASGVFLPQTGSLLMRDSPLLSKGENSWSGKAALKEAKYWKGFLMGLNSSTFLSQKYRIANYVKALQAHYDVGRVLGSSNFSFVYWLGKDSTCPTCKYLANISPIPKELLPTTPRAGSCRCYANCNCRLKIVPVTVLEYNERKLQVPNLKTIISKIGI